MNRRNLLGVVAAGAAALAIGVTPALADSDTYVVGAGNGGVAVSSANGGVVTETEYYYDVLGQVYEYEYTSVSANGGTSIADASGGSYNIAVLGVDNSEVDEVE